jgi:hypothetical protein
VPRGTTRTAVAPHAAACTKTQPVTTRNNAGEPRARRAHAAICYYQQEPRGRGFMHFEGWSAPPPLESCPGLFRSRRRRRSSSPHHHGPQEGQQGGAVGGARAPRRGGGGRPPQSPGLYRRRTPAAARRARARRRPRAARAPPPQSCDPPRYLRTRAAQPLPASCGALTRRAPSRLALPPPAAAGGVAGGQGRRGGRQEQGQRGVQRRPVRGRGGALHGGHRG